MNLLRNSEKDYFQKLDIKDLTDKKFKKTVESFFSTKDLKSRKLMLREDVLISDEKALATLMNKYFVNITADFDVKRDSETHSDTPTSVNSILERFHFNQSILKFRKPLIRLISFPFMR